MSLKRVVWQVQRRLEEKPPARELRKVRRRQARRALRKRLVEELVRRYRRDEMRFSKDSESPAE